MKRYRTQKTTVGVSLFPFLAVLICTMGALIVLLVLVVQMARVDASESMHQGRYPGAARCAAGWKKKITSGVGNCCEQQRVKVQEEAAGKRLGAESLGGAHSRAGAAMGSRLRQAAADLQLRMQGEDQDQDASTRRSLSNCRKRYPWSSGSWSWREQAAKQPPVYAIVPYDGPQRHASTTRSTSSAERRSRDPARRNVCCRCSDFHGPLGPGNPLDAALRAIREYYARLGATGSQGEPYPLLIVRPGGIESYAMARAAMRSWDDEFGYELVDESMQLKYPDSDPALGQLLQKVDRRRAITSGNSGRGDAQPL